MEGFVFLKDAAGRLDVSLGYLKKWICQGYSPIVKEGRLTKSRQQDLEAWVRVGLHVPEVAQ